VVAVALALFIAAAARGQWTQYGGPGQDFKVADAGLAEKWPADGPRKIWTRKLGSGYSAILANDGCLYTMYRSGAKEIAISLDADTGETLWEYGYVSRLPEGHHAEYGEGPNATPLWSEGRLYTVGVAGILHCLEATTGEPLWSHDLLGEFGGNVLELGYSSSPIEYRGTVIVLVGGKDQSIVAFDKKDGRVVWKNLSFENSYSTPRILRICGEDQLVTFMATEVVGVDPGSGALIWQYPIRNEYKQNITMPTLLDDDLLLISTWKAGSRGLRLVKGEPWRVEEFWSTRKVQSFYESSVRIGDHVYGSSGPSAAHLMCAIKARTGRIAWRVRGFASANVVAVGDRMIILEEDGHLALATPRPDGLTVHSKVRVMQAPSRTVPTIVGKTMFVRDFHNITALDLG
jgi:outer membrane protein assembly factor BamB